MPLIKNTLVAASLLTVLVSMMVFIPSQSNMAVFSVSASPYFSEEGFYKILFGFSGVDGSYSVELYADDFSSGVSVPVGTELISIVLYANVSAARYTVSPSTNTWMNLTVQYPTSLTAYTGNYKVDACYAYNSTDGFLGTGYQASAEYYNVIRTFYVMKTLTEGIWLVTGSIYIL